MLQLLSKLTPNGRVAYVMAQHMARDGHIELVLKLLNRQQNLPVTAAQANELIKADHVYLIPPACVGVVWKGRIQLLPTTSDYISCPSVNALFHSIAAQAGNKGIGIVLSGTGLDGAVGSRAIKAHGGLIIAQSPESAAFPGMPSAVIESKAAHQVLSPEEIGRYINTKFPATKSPAATHVQTITLGAPVSPDLQLAALVKMIFDATGVDYSSYKEETLMRRIDSRISRLQLSSFQDYQEYIRKNPQELHILQGFFLVSLSSFFRDNKAFAIVRKHLIDLVSQKKPGKSIRIWVPGCATGEECYTFAILLAEILGEKFTQTNIEIIGSDLNPEALNKAEAGCYRQTALKETEPAIVEHYFEHKGQEYRVAPPVRDICRFIRQNVLDTAPPENLDMISCRNLLIYMKRNLQSQLFRKFHQVLLPQGLLFIGQAENVGLMGSSLFTEVDRYHRLYRRKN